LSDSPRPEERFAGILQRGRVDSLPPLAHPAILCWNVTREPWTTSGLTVC
jgi:hypothetical protein